LALPKTSPGRRTRGEAPFSEPYAAVYDLLYADKSYESECQLLDEILSAWEGGVRSVLDLGCGTGGHARRLAEKGYAVTGVDRSAAMLMEARRHAGDETLAGERPRFVKADIRELDMGDTFDAAIAMFAVLGYMTSDADLERALHGMRTHLRDGGAVVFDGWWGPGVLTSPPTDRVKTVEGGGERVVRRARSRLELEADVVHVHYTFERFQGERLVQRGEEMHSVRFHFRESLQDLLARAGLRLLRLRSFADPARSPTSEDWTYLAVAQAR
jgi:SAM-dependent methyltransferase